MHGFDLTPLLRHSIGFDRLNRVFDSAQRLDESNGYPPYNIEKTGDHDYRISMAVAGFGDDDLDVTVKDNVLTVTGEIRKTEEEKQAERFLHRGIAGRSFERRFQLDDHIQVSDASLEHGLLHIDLVREVPEELKPRKIAIQRSGAKAKVIEGSKAA